MNIVDNLIARMAQREADLIWRGSVAAISGNLISVIRVDQSAPDTQPYAHLASYTPTIGDEVLVAKCGRGYIVLGQILR